MNYDKNYYEYINYVKNLNRKKNQGVYYEEHHIVPRSIGGNNSKDNLVLLTSREHYLAHYLLIKMHEKNKDWKYRNMCFAFHMMNWKPKASLEKVKYFNSSSRLYAASRDYLAEASSLLNKGRTHSEEVNKKKASAQGKSWYYNKKNENKLLFPEEVTEEWSKGRILSEDHSRKLAEHARKLAAEGSNVRGKTWKLEEKTKEKHRGKRWYYHKITGELKQFSVVDEEHNLIDGNMWRKGRNDIGKRKKNNE